MGWLVTIKMNTRSPYSLTVILSPPHFAVSLFSLLVHQNDLDIYIVERNRTGRSVKNFPLHKKGDVSEG